MRHFAVLPAVLAAALLGGASTRCNAAIINPFDAATGATTYDELQPSNWVTTFEGLTPNAGTEFLASANGNNPGLGSALGFAKDLGGAIEATPYRVSFFIAKYYPDRQLSGVHFEDFNRLRIGGPDGTMEWTETPPPSVQNQWMEWVGIYRPAPSDVGRPFTFEANLRLDGQKSVAFDGPVQVVAVPEPTLVGPLALGGLVFLHRGRRRGA
jgi:hypothetical protein